MHTFENDEWLNPKGAQPTKVVIKDEFTAGVRVKDRITKDTYEPSPSAGRLFREHDSVLYKGKIWKVARKGREQVEFTKLGPIIVFEYEIERRSTRGVKSKTVPESRLYQVPGRLFEPKNNVRLSGDENKNVKWRIVHYFYDCGWFYHVRRVRKNGELADGSGPNDFRELSEEGIKRYW